MKMLGQSKKKHLSINWRSSYLPLLVQDIAQTCGGHQSEQQPSIKLKDSDLQFNSHRPYLLDIGQFELHGELEGFL